ncbi:MFS transporter [Pontibacter sp. G13]|uniref:MFS transporter n=1 Tax=Pontibacter sp. G13 TaxID=3074898 RepID=UPI00288A217E|nr:MFS transporter [Pontibacter sp. G13]WNJ21246.1 MFS transporter [Pontibacter sp. G13]
MDKQINRNLLFLASCLALISTSMSFAIRGDLMGVWGDVFSLTSEQVGWVTGTAFWGFTLAMVIGGPIVDIVGMKRIMGMAFVGHAAGIALTIMASGFWTLFLGTLLIGIANGFVEAACNPLVAGMYTDNKTKMLNRFHVWFPGGIALGGVLMYLMSGAGLSWQLKVATMAIPTILYGVIFFGQKFPQTERVASGLTMSDMFKACTRPLFLFMVGCMLLTAATELGTNQWITSLLENVGVASILVLVFINVLMASGRMFAGPIVHRFSESGMLLFSAIFSGLGLYLMSITSGYAIFAAAGVFAIGITFFWPTMLGYVNTKMPETGALGLSIMGGAGMLSTSLILPMMGKVYDGQVQAAIESGVAEAQAGLVGGATTLSYMVVLPIILVAAFAYLHFVVGKNKTEVAEKAEA